MPTPKQGTHEALPDCKICAQMKRWVVVSPCTVGQPIGEGLHLLGGGRAFFFPQRLHHLAEPPSPVLLGLHLPKGGDFPSCTRLHNSATRVDSTLGYMHSLSGARVRNQIKWQAPCRIQNHPYLHPLNQNPRLSYLAKCMVHNSIFSQWVAPEASRSSCKGASGEPSHLT